MRYARSSDVDEVRSGAGDVSIGGEERRWRCEHGRQSSGTSGLAQVRVRVKVRVRVRERMGGGLGENEGVREWV